MFDSPRAAILAAAIRAQFDLDGESPQAVYKRIKQPLVTEPEVSEPEKPHKPGKSHDYSGPDIFVVPKNIVWAHLKACRPVKVRIIPIVSSAQPSTR